MSRLRVHKIVTGSLRENCYVVSSSDGDAVIVDPGGEFDQIASHVTAAGLHVHAVMNTHAHPDHLSAAVQVIERYDAPFYLHPDDEPLLPRANFYRRFTEGEAEPIRVPREFSSLADVGTLSFGSLVVTAIHTPGHTQGSMCFEIGGELFTGDTIMDGELGRADLPGSDPRALEASVELLAERYPPETMIHPGHGGPGRLCDVTADATGASGTGSRA